MIDIICLAYENMCDTGVLVSEDSDFVPIVKRVKELDKLTNTLKEEF